MYCNYDSYINGYNYSLRWHTITPVFTAVTPPPAPTLVSPLTGATGLSLTPTLQWNASTGADSYQVQVSTLSTFASTVVDHGLGVLTYTVPAMTLAWNTTYSWRVRAYSSLGGYSAWSTVRTFKTGAGYPPNAPTFLTATAMSPTRIDLTWVDNSDETGFKIERMKTGGAYTQVATVLAGVTSYSNTSGLVGGTTYTYRVRANRGTTLNSAYSNEAWATTWPAPPAQVPGVPIWPRPTIRGASITFNWDAASGIVDYYWLQVNTSPLFTGTDKFNGSVGNVTSYTVNGFLDDGTIYYWRIKAHNAKGFGLSSSTYAFLNGPPGPSSITVTIPNINLVWSAGSTRTITWTYTGGNAATVTIELYKGGVLNRSIATGVAMGNSGSGSYNWPIPPGQAEGTDYRIKLTTSNALTDSSDVNFTIKVPQRIQVELSWNTSGTDVDTMFYSPTDSLCYYANKTPNWGTYGNPVLDRDDVDGYGPEVLTLNNPGTGVYKYKVYYYSDHGLATPATTATVKVWIDGVLQGTWSQAITNHRTWNVCTITGPACTVAYVGGVTEPPAGEIRDETKPLK